MHDVIRNVRSSTFFSRSYYIIHYEDLVSEPLLHLRRLYDFMGFPFGSREEAMVRRHVDADDRDGAEIKKYYSTYRCGSHRCCHIFWL